MFDPHPAPYFGSLDFSDLTDEDLQISPVKPLTEKVPTIPDMTEGKILAHGFLNDVVDLTEIEAKEQEFLVNLIHGNSRHHKQSFQVVAGMFFK